MSGRYSEMPSRETCPECLRNGRGPTSTTYYVSTEPDITVFQIRCTNRQGCGWVETRATTTGVEVRRALAQARSRARVFAMVAVGELAALGAMAVGASALAAMR